MKCKMLKSYLCSLKYRILRITIRKCDLRVSLNNNYFHGDDLLSDEDNGNELIGVPFPTIIYSTRQNMFHPQRRYLQPCRYVHTYLCCNLFHLRFYLVDKMYALGSSVGCLSLDQSVSESRDSNRYGYSLVCHLCFAGLQPLASARNSGKTQGQLGSVGGAGRIQISRHAKLCFRVLSAYRNRPYRTVEVRTSATSSVPAQVMASGQSFKRL